MLLLHTLMFLVPLLLELLSLKRLGDIDPAALEGTIREARSFSANSIYSVPKRF